MNNKPMTCADLTNQEIDKTAERLIVRPAVVGALAGISQRHNVAAVALAGAKAVYELPMYDEVMLSYRDDYRFDRVLALFGVR